MIRLTAADFPFMSLSVSNPLRAPERSDKQKETSPVIAQREIVSAASLGRGPVSALVRLYPQYFQPNRPRRRGTLHADRNLRGTVRSLPERRGG